VPSIRQLYIFSKGRELKSAQIWVKRVDVADPNLTPYPGRSGTVTGSVSGLNHRVSLTARIVPRFHRLLVITNAGGIDYQ